MREFIKQKILEIDNVSGRLHSYFEVFSTTDKDGNQYDRYEEWDVDWCQRDQCYYAHNVCGCPCPIPDPEVGFNRILLDLIFELENIAIDGESTYWCDSCEDEFPQSKPCEHRDPEDEEYSSPILAETMIRAFTTLWNIKVRERGISRQNGIQKDVKK